MCNTITERNLMKRTPLFISLILFAACASSHRSPAPVTVVVIAQEADRNDADRLRAFTEEAIQRYGGSPRVGVVTIDYFGPANRVALPRPEITRGANGELVYAAFTITDRAGNVLRSERLPYIASIDQLKALHDTADIIAKRVAQIVDVVVTATQPYCESDVTLLREITDAAIRRRVHDAAVMKVASSTEYRSGA